MSVSKRPGRIESVKSGRGSPTPRAIAGGQTSQAASLEIEILGRFVRRILKDLFVSDMPFRFARSVAERKLNLFRFGTCLA
jgi:hypothetical protein